MQLWGKNYWRIYYAVSGHPGTLEEIIERTGMSKKTILIPAIQRLSEFNEIRSIKLGATNKEGVFSGVYKILGEIAGSPVYFCPYDGTFLGSYITGFLPREMTSASRVRLEQQFKIDLPAQAYGVVRDYLDRHTAKI
jgi:hypothetical protein